MKKEIRLELAYRLINHGPVVLVSTLYKGRPNFCTISWVTPIDYDMVALVISDENYTFECVVKTGEFVINIPNRNLVRQVVAAGSVSGERVDKFRRLGLTLEEPRLVKAPRIAECIGHLECRLVKGREKLAKEYNLFIADVVAAAARKELFDTKWDVRKKKAATLHHLGGNNFAVPAGRIVK